MGAPKKVADEVILGLLPATVRELRDATRLDPNTIRWRLRRLEAVRQRRTVTGNWGAHGPAADLWHPPGTKLAWSTDRRGRR